MLITIFLKNILDKICIISRERHKIVLLDLFIIDSATVKQKST